MCHHSNINFKLLLYSGRALEATLGQGLQQRQLNDSVELSRKLSAEELYFFVLTNLELDKYIKKHYSKHFIYGRQALESLFGNETDKLINDALVFKASKWGEDSDILYHLILTEHNEKQVNSGSTLINKYVGNYFGIDDDTVGVVLSYSDKPQIDDRESLKKLLYTLERMLKIHHQDPVMTLCSAGLVDHYYSNPIIPRTDNSSELAEVE